MQKFFISEAEFSNKILTDDVAFQIRSVLRSRINDEILLGLNGKTYRVIITEITNKEVRFSLLKEETGNHEQPVFISLFQGYPKGDKLESIIKYGTQLGINEINPILMKRSIFKLDSNKKDSKLLRFTKIAMEAAEQSFRDVVPKICDIKRLEECDFSSYDIKMVCYEETAKQGEISAFKRTLKNMKINDKVAIVVGPEGGITPEEINHLEDLGFICVGLGPRILRTETVVFYVLSVISYELEMKI